ncbi:ATP-binding protein [Lachnospiraceae bacterium]|nr:ATP-binding protein [Lachnospiraceae bacterium]
MTSTIKSHILSTLEGGGFQDLCDTLLCAEGYEGIFSLGMKAGSLKTTIGNPDTYFRSKSGKYIFVAYTTEQTNINKKIKEDVEKCLDQEKTGVDVKDIEKIICCHTSSTLKAGDDQALRELCGSYGVELELYGIDRIADKIYRNYQYIAKDKLNLSIDSNQIFPREEFIKRYDSSNGRTAPLTTTFLYREKEKKEILEALEEKKIIVILGKAGVGKTRLALEIVKEYQEKNKCKILCIKCNDQPIMDDLSRHIYTAGKYLIFVDDANELVGLSHLVEYVIRDDKRYDIRIIATVRDYASKSVINETEKLGDIKCFAVSKFTDQEIRDFVKTNLRIENSDYIEQIVRIASGNPRIAHMAGKLAKEKNDLRSIANMEELYKSYYSSFLETTTILTNIRLCLTVGVTTIFNTIDLENLDRIQDILDMIGMTKEEFTTNIHSLHSMEYVEIKSERVARISDQCLSNYMLYYVFFEKRLIAFSGVLRAGFWKYKKSTIKTVDILLNVFYSDKMKDYLTEEISKVWDELKTDDKVFEEFVKAFHIFKPEESLLYVSEKIEQAESATIDIRLLEDEEKKWNVDIKDSILQLLNGYKKNYGLVEAVELAIRYCMKRQDAVKLVYSLFKSYYSINKYSYYEDYYVQNLIIDKIRENLDYPVIKKLFYKISSHYLSLYFDCVEIERDNVFTSYRIGVALTEGCKQYRSKIWMEIISLANDKENLEDIVYLLCAYPNLYVNKSVFSDELEFDWQNISLVLERIRVYMEPFRFAYICSRFFRMSEMHSVELTEKYSEVFNTEEWNIYKVLSNQFYRDTSSYEERKAIFESNIRRCYERYSADQMDNLVQYISNIIGIIGSRKADMGEGITTFCTFLAHNKEKLWAFVLAFFKFGENIEFRSEALVAPLLKYFDCKKVKDSIWNASFPMKKQWQFTYYEMIAENEVTQDDYRRLMELVTESKVVCEKEKFEINLRLLDKFKKYSPNIYVSITKALLNEVENNTSLCRRYFSNLFDANYYTPKEVLNIYQDATEELRHIYLKCLLGCSYIDYRGIFLSGFILQDIEWVKWYARYIQETQENYSVNDEEYRMETCWKLRSFLNIFDLFFDELLCDRRFYWHSRSYFRKLLSFDGKKELDSRKEQWIIHYIRENSNSENLIELFGILQEIKKEIRKKAILCFLECNSNFELFSRLSLVSNSWTGTSSLTDKIIFCEELLSEISGVQFLEHKKRIRDEIAKWKAVRNREEVDEILMELYR